MPFRRLILVVVLATLGIAVQACAGRGPPTLALMPAPEAFSEGAFDRSADDRPVGDIPDGGLLYATGRQKSRGNAPGDFYTTERSLVVHIGEAKISVRRPGRLRACHVRGWRWSPMRGETGDRGRWTWTRRPVVVGVTAYHRTARGR